MACYISSNANRLYTALEAAYGETPAITAANRIPAVKLKAQQRPDVAARRDKSGSRTFFGNPVGVRRSTTFDLTTYMTSWSQAGEPAYGPLVRAALGEAPMTFAGGTVAAGSNETTLAFVAPHGLIAGQAVVVGGELRFVDFVVNANVVGVNSPFSVSPAVGGPVGPTVTYKPKTTLPSVSVYDYWSPSTAVQRILCGAAVDQMEIKVNADYHEFRFAGGAQDVIDSVSFESGQAGLGAFPAEPASAAFDSTILPGHLGQVWMGLGPSRFYSLTEASVKVDNDIDFRAREFGSALPRCIVPGQRAVTVEFDLVEQDDDATKAMYQAARQQSPVPVMFQLGMAAGSLCGVYAPSLLAEVPEFEDGDRRVEWRFRDSRAVGTVDDEIVVAFG